MSVLQFFIKLPKFLTILRQIFVFDPNLSVSTILIKNKNGLEIVNNVANFMKSCKTDTFYEFFRIFDFFCEFCKFLPHISVIFFIC